jgi:hypothetical protein
MRFGTTTVLAHAAALAATSFPVATVACNARGHSRSGNERMCSHDDTTFPASSSLSLSRNIVNGLAGDVNGRRAQASFRVGERDFGTWQEFAANPLHRCATTPPAEEQMKQLPQILYRWQERMAGPSASSNNVDGSEGDTDLDENERRRRRRLQDETIVIPVYFHVILNTEGTKGIVSAETIEQQFNIMDASFAPYFSFSLESTDESKNTRWFTATPSSVEETEMKTALRQGGNDALNLYTSNIDGVSLGWAIFPIAGTGSPGAAVPIEDGVVVRFDSLPGGDLFPFNEGDTAVHETGHWLGLLHTFDGETCSGSGDMIDDTPFEVEPGYGCPTTRDVSTFVFSCVVVIISVYGLVVIIALALAAWMDSYLINLT